MSTKLLGASLALALACPEALAVTEVMGAMCAFPKGSTPNKYKPHQGKREIERRAKRLRLAPNRADNR